MRRIGLVVFLAFIITFAPLGAEGQPPKNAYRIGIIIASSPAARAAGAEPEEPAVAALRRGLRDLGYVYGRDFVTEARSMEGRSERIPAIAADLGTLKVDV